MFGSPFTLIVLLILAMLVAILLIRRNRSGKGKLTPLAGLAFAFIVAGIVYGENRNVGYPLIGVGIILAAADMMRKTGSEDTEDEINSDE